jgi:hypothetical protein
MFMFIYDILEHLLNRNDFALEGIRYFLKSVGYLGFIEVNIPTQPVVHSPTIVVGRLDDKLTPYIHCMVPP